MSRLWCFCSYTPSRFEGYFDGTEFDAARQLFEAATWDDGVWDDLAELCRLAKQISAAGIRYDGLSAGDATALDKLLPMLFGPEGLAEHWEVVAESPDGLHPSVVRELMLRVDGAMLLPILLKGRRFGAGEPSECEYCFLSPAECVRLSAEAEQALASGGPWSGAWIPDVVRECLIGPLRAASAKGKSLFGSLG